MILTAAALGACSAGEVEPALGGSASYQSQQAEINARAQANFDQGGPLASPTPPAGQSVRDPFVVGIEDAWLGLPIAEQERTCELIETAGMELYLDVFERNYVLGEAFDRRKAETFFNQRCVLKQ